MHLDVTTLQAVLRPCMAAPPLRRPSQSAVGGRQGYFTGDEDHTPPPERQPQITIAFVSARATLLLNLFFNVAIYVYLIVITIHL